jgi:DNA-directed RNA polymerase alpha subunit
LFELTDSTAELYVEFRVEKGYGYYSMEYLRTREEKADDTDTNLLLIDNDFSCVTACSYEVEDVLAFAGEVLASYAKLFVFSDAFIDRSVLIDHMDIQDQYTTAVAHTGSDSGLKTQPIEIL